MRIHLKTTPNTENVPFNYQTKLIGTIHKWLGNNEIHNRMSLYSFSWLMNGKREVNGLSFRNGSSWFLSFYESKYIKKITQSIIDSPLMFYGMKVTEVTIEDIPDLSNKNYFLLGSPVFIKRLENGHYRHYTYEDPEACTLMEETLRHKMELAGLPDDPSLRISFDLSYSKKKVKLVRIHHIENKCSMCPLIIHGSPRTKAFAWTAGIGNLTGSSLGSIY